MNSTQFIEKAQELLDSGCSPNKSAELLKVQHKKITRLIGGGLLEVYQAFDEDEDTFHLYQNFEWLYEQDKLEEIFFGVLDSDFILPAIDQRNEDWFKVSKYVRENFGDILNYAFETSQLEAVDSILVECAKCNEVKNLNNFTPKHNGGFFGLDGRCKKCCAERSIEWYYDNTDKAKASAKNWMIANKDKVSESQKLSYQKRLARKASLPDNLTEIELRATLQRFDNKCAISEDYDELHLDHVIPLSIGHGGTTYGNMIPLRADLNMSKNNKNIFGWFESNRQRFELSQERFDNLIDWLALVNAITVEEYRNYVYWCHANPRSINEIKTEGGTTS